MKRETKVGLLVGLLIIVLIGIVVSDHLSVVQQQDSAALDGFAGDAQRGIDGGAPPANSIGERDPRVETNDHGTRRNEGEPIPPPNPRPEGNANNNRRNDNNNPPPRPGPRDRRPNNDVEELAPSYHRVEAGDNLWKLAQKFYGDGAKYWKELKRANPNAVGANDSLKLGTRLVIPNKATLDARLGRANNSDPVRDNLTDPAARDLYDQLRPRPNGSQPNTPRPTAQIAVAKPGDTLSHLAARHLGSSRHWRALLQANRDQLSSEHDLRPGMKLKLPTIAQPSSTNTANNSNNNTPTPPATPTANQYKVKPGDTFYAIARRTLGDGNRWREIYNANRSRIRNPNALPAGLTLVIPR